MAIETLAQLEGVVGKKPPALDLKVLDHIDATSQTWLSHARAMMACFGAGVGGDGGPHIALAGGEAGFAAGSDTALTIPLASFDETEGLVPGAPFGSLWLVPAMRETLRVNGVIDRVDAGVEAGVQAGSEVGTVTIRVQECYLHCAKAFIRSDFWAAAAQGQGGGDDRAFAADARFMALGTISAQGEADVSPKGDPVGKLVQEEGECLLFPDRPGNRRTDSFRNILTQPRVAAALIAPGRAEVMFVRGQARLSAEEDQRARFAVEGKAPKLVVALDAPETERRASPALERAELWSHNPPPPPADLEPAKIFAAHMRLSKQKSLSARLTKAAVSVPGLVQRGLDKDYDTNLY
ncbi:MAG: pyridoxamine 5'-phosphate oxidase family protein [Pseudomonadota bacterium]